MEDRVHPHAERVSVHLIRHQTDIRLLVTPCPSNPTPSEAERQLLILSLNRRRIALGLPPVVVDEELSVGARKHCEFLNLNPERVRGGLTAHLEAEGLPGYSVQGALAAKASVISYCAPSQAIELFFASVFHRLPLLSPHLAQVGLGTLTPARDLVGDVRADDTFRSIPSVKAITVLDVQSKLDWTCLSGGVVPVKFPAPGDLDVPLHFGGEVPSPLPASHPSHQLAGFPITLTFFQEWRKTIDLRVAVATLHECVPPPTVGGPESSSVLK
eukprot:gene8110-9636_t